MKFSFYGGLLANRNEDYQSTPDFCLKFAPHEEVLLTHLDGVIIWAWVFLLVEVALDTKERVSYTTVTMLLQGRRCSSCLVACVVTKLNDL